MGHEPASSTGARRTVLTGHTDRVRRAMFRPDGARLATAGTDKTVKIWDLPSGKELLSLPHSAPLMAARWAAGGRWLVSLDEAGTVGIFDAETGTKLGEVEGHGGGIDVAIAPDASVFARSANEDKIFLYALPSGAKTKEMEGTVGQGFGIGFSPDGRRLASAHLDGKARIWDVASGKLVATLDSGRPLVNVVWDPRGRWVATGGSDRRVRTWDPDSGRELAAQPMVQDVYWVAVSPDGKQIAAASLGPDALVWNVPSWEGDVAELDRTISCRVPWRLQNGGLVAAEATPNRCVGAGVNGQGR